MIYFNNVERHNLSKKVLSLEEEKEVMTLLNNLLEGGKVTKDDEALLQRFVDSYQRLSQFRDTTEGAYCTDNKEATNKEDFFQPKL